MEVTAVASLVELEVRDSLRVRQLSRAIHFGSFTPTQYCNVVTIGYLIGPYSCPFDPVARKWVRMSALFAVSVLDHHRVHLAHLKANHSVDIPLFLTLLYRCDVSLYFWTWSFGPF